MQSNIHPLSQPHALSHSCNKSRAITTEQGSAFEGQAPQQVEERWRTKPGCPGFRRTAMMAESTVVTSKFVAELDGVVARMELDGEGKGGVSIADGDTALGCTIGDQLLKCFAADCKPSASASSSVCK